LVDKTKILLAIGPRLLRKALISLIRRQDDMEIVGEALDPIKLLLALSETQAAVVVMSLEDSDQEPSICSHMLAEYPKLLILALSPNRENGYLMYQRTVKEQFSGASDDEILSAIRKAENGIDGS
jgi:DNA-binding NarL/FixJ family response regulator